MLFKTNCKCDFVHNNMVEIVNGNILEARYKPAKAIVLEIYHSMMTRKNGLPL